MNVTIPSPQIAPISAAPAGRAGLLGRMRHAVLRRIRSAVWLALDMSTEFSAVD